MFESFGRFRTKAGATFLLAACAFVAFVIAGRLQAEEIRFKDLPLQLQKDLETQSVTAEAFGPLVAQVRKISNDRMADGEAEHLIYFVLQSNRFTKRPRIDPVVNAREFIECLDPSERTRLLSAGGAISRSAGEKISPDVLARMADFRHMVRSDKYDSRIGYFSRLFASIAPEDAMSLMRVSYIDTVRFLYKLELQASAKRGETGGEVEALYRQRGFDSEAQLEANFSVWQALEVLASRTRPPSSSQPATKAGTLPAELNNVLVVGPGVHFAPSTGLDDEFEPESYEPYAIADALLRLKLANPEKLRIKCVDLNPRVVGAIRDMRAAKQPTMNLVSSFERERLSAHFADYFGQLGTAIGTEARANAVPALRDSRFHKTIAIRSEVAQAVNAQTLDIITDRLDGSPAFDLVVVTNVLKYFGSLELAFALTNITSMMKPGAYLIHNETDPHMESVSPFFGLSHIESSTFRLSPDRQEPALMQSFVIQQKKPAAQKQ